MLAPFGSWQSPITSELIVAESIGISSPHFHQNDIYWLESRPQEDGRNVLVREMPNGDMEDLNSAPLNIRTRVHEYGGDAFLLHENFVYFSNFADQQIYKQNLSSLEVHQLTDAPHCRFANYIMDSRKQRLIAILEDHSSNTHEASNKLCAIDLHSGVINILAEGADFYSAPALNPKQDQLTWITWQHPHMPWDQTQLWLADINADGGLFNQQTITGDLEDISIQQPQFSPQGMLYFISDESGWWNIYRLEDGKQICVLAKEAEFGVPHWVFGQRTYLFSSENEIICLYSKDSESQLASINLKNSSLSEIRTTYSSISGLDYKDGKILCMAASATEFSSVIRFDHASQKSRIIKSTNTASLDKSYLSTPQTITFPSGDDEIAHGFYYPPKNKDYIADKDEVPPLLVMLHGGPTGATDNALSLAKQFWTSRGIAVLDLDYRGSTGYGRIYRNKLRGNWGIVDVEDCVFACRYLVEQGLVDGDRLAIRGGSAGGFTTLAALTFTDTFKAGASHYGVSDLEALAKDTHKFESRYLDSMIGPYPERQDIYIARSPIHHVEQLKNACIFFQGLEDKVVLPNQAEVMVKALEKNGVPVAYVPFEGEQHGFRQAKNIKRSLDLELYFYSKIFEFSVADQIEPIKIINL